MGNLATQTNSGSTDISTLHADLATAGPIGALVTQLQGMVDGLEALTTASNSKLDALTTAITTLQGYTDGLEALIGSTNSGITALQGFTDGLETLIGSTNTALSTLHADVDQLEGYTDGIETKLDAIATNQGVPSGGPKFGAHYTIIATGNGVNFASKAFTRGMTIVNLDNTNSLLVSVGVPGSADVDTFTVKAGQPSPFIACSNANVPALKSSAGTISACYIGA